MGRNLGCLGKEAFHHFDSAYQGFASGDLEKMLIQLERQLTLKLSLLQLLSVNHLPRMLVCMEKELVPSM